MTMSVLDAACLVVRDYPGGAAALAPRMGKAESSLQHECNPRYPTAKLGLQDAVTISQYAGDLRILNAFAAQLGCMVMPLPDAHAEPRCVMSAASAIAREFGDAISKVSAVMEDGRVSRNELAEWRREMADLMRALQQTDTALQARYMSGHPMEAA